MKDNNKSASYFKQCILSWESGCSKSLSSA